MQVQATHQTPTDIATMAVAVFEIARSELMALEALRLEQLRATDPSDIWFSIIDQTVAATESRAKALHEAHELLRSLSRCDQSALRSILALVGK